MFGSFKTLKMQPIMTARAKVTKDVAKELERVISSFISTKRKELTGRLKNIHDISPEELAQLDAAQPIIAKYEKQIDALMKEYVGRYYDGNEYREKIDKIRNPMWKLQREIGTIKRRHDSYIEERDTTANKLAVFNATWKDPQKIIAGLNLVDRVVGYSVQTRMFNGGEGECIVALTEDVIIKDVERWDRYSGFRSRNSGDKWTVNLGKYEIIIPMVDKAADIEFIPLNIKMSQNDIGNNRGHDDDIRLARSRHPHHLGACYYTEDGEFVYASRTCWGSYAGQIQDVISRKDIVMLLNMSVDFLYTYNKNSPLSSIYEGEYSWATATKQE